MLRQAIGAIALSAILAAPIAAQPPTSAADSAWAATLLASVRPLIGSRTVVAVIADTSRREAAESPRRSMALAAALATALRVPGPRTGAAQVPAPVCGTSSSPAGIQGVPGEVASVLWLPYSRPGRALVAITVSCRFSGPRSFAEGVLQGFVQSTDGSWHVDGPPSRWIS